MSIGDGPLDASRCHFCGVSGDSCNLCIVTSNIIVPESSFAPSGNRICEACEPVPSTMAMLIRRYPHLSFSRFVCTTRATPRFEALVASSQTPPHLQQTDLALVPKRGRPELLLDCMYMRRGCTICQNCSATAAYAA